VRPLVGTRGEGEVAGAANHIGFRYVRDAATTKINRRKTVF
jgi:hypothetical protein